MDRRELIKQAYAYGASIALQEAGYAPVVAEQVGVKLAAEADAEGVGAEEEPGFFSRNKGKLIAGGAGLAALGLGGAGLHYLRPDLTHAALDKVTGLGSTIGEKAKSIGGTIGDKAKSIGGTIGDKARSGGSGILDKIKAIRHEALMNDYVAHNPIASRIKSI